MRLDLELIKCRNDNATQKFYRLRMFRNGEVFDENFKILKNFNFFFHEVLLYELSEREPG